MFYLNIKLFHRGDGAVAYGNALFGQGTGPILIDDLACTSSDHNINDCAYTSQHNCGHQNDASVICKGKVSTHIIRCFFLCC